jgi:hypothetical protein
MKIKLAFTDFWSGFEPSIDPIFGKLLKENFNIEYNNISPDFVIFSAWGDSFRRYNCKKILYTPENFFVHSYPAFEGQLGLTNLYKYANFSITSFDLKDSRNFRMPCYIRRYGYDIKNDICNRNFNKSLKTKKILFLHNCDHEFRNNFALELNKHIQVDRPGRCLRNMNITVDDKIEFSKQYKFLLAFENSSTINYNTEKITDAYVSKCIPIYWGDANIENDFNKDSMLNYHRYSNQEQFIQKIIEMNNNDDLYYQTLLASPIINNELFNPLLFIEFMKDILNKG